MNNEKLDKYKQELVAELQKQGASETELLLITDEMVINAINNSRSAGDVAWALMQ